MTGLPILGLAALVVAAQSIAAQEADFYVSPEGDDTWSGMRAAPNGNRDDGPFATVHQAQQAVRQLKEAEPDRDAPITVLLRGGAYELDQPIVFTPEDSGRPGAQILYDAYPGEQPVLSGGRRLSGFRVNGEGHWELEIPDVAVGTWSFSQLFVDGKRRSRPRLPDAGYYYILKGLSPSNEAAGGRPDRFGFIAGDIRPDWQNLSDVEVLAFHQWSMSHLRIADVDEERSIVRFTGPTCSNSYWAGLGRGQRYLVDNVREALDSPGEWYLDRASGLLTYIPEEGEDPNAVEVVAPQLEQLVLFRGDPVAGMPVEHIELRGITFAHTSRNTPETGYSLPQAEAALSAAIGGTGAADCALVDCTVAHVGAYAVEWGEGCKRCRVEDCDLFDMGAGGVKIGTQAIPPNEANHTSHCDVIGNRIAHGGRTHPAAIGVWIGHSPYNRIENNDIYDFYYTGISMGWQWGYAESLAHHNTISRNHIYRLGDGVLSDMGGIYTLGPTPGTVISLNRFHDIESYSYGGWGIYFDQATTDILAENNLVYRTKTGGFHQHFGKDNRVVNNIFAFAREGQIQRTRPEEHISFFFEGNIVYWFGGPLLHGNWSDANYRMSKNLYWDASGAEISFAGRSLDDWQAAGQDTDSVIADPLFVDPENDDFSLRNTDVVSRIGFVPFDLSETGCLTADDRPPIAEMPRAFPGFEEAPALPLSEDFEDAAVGDKAPSAQTYEDATVTAATARVTDEIAATGGQCLKFADAPDQENPWDPHVYYDPRMNDGVLRGSFDLRIEPGCVFYHEWRDTSPPRYRVGPSLTIGADRMLKASGQDVIEIPEGEWISIEIECGVGPDADGTYTLTVTIPGRGAPITITDLPADPELAGLRWFGFCSQATAEGVFYVDNVQVGP